MGKEVKELDIFRVYKLLDHPVRKEIIELLGEQDRLGFKELKERLRINVGAFILSLRRFKSLKRPRSEQSQ